MSRASLIALAVLAVGALVLAVRGTWPPEAAAHPGPGHVDSFSVSCGTTATSLKAPSGAQYAYRCQNTSTTAVFVGDNDLTTTTAPSYCATNCPDQEWGGSYREEFCLVAAGSVTVVCRAMVAAAP